MKSVAIAMPIPNSRPRAFNIHSGSKSFVEEEREERKKLSPFNIFMMAVVSFFCARETDHESNEESEKTFIFKDAERGEKSSSR